MLGSQIGVPQEVRWCLGGARAMLQAYFRDRKDATRVVRYQCLDGEFSAAENRCAVVHSHGVAL